MEIKISLSHRIPKPVRIIKVDGLEWDLEDVLETLYEIDGRDSYLLDDELTQKLLELKVVNSLGSSRWCSPPEKGENFESFFNIIKEMYNVHSDTLVSFGLKHNLPEDRKEVKVTMRYGREHRSFE